MFFSQYVTDCQYEWCNNMHAAAEQYIYTYTKPEMDKKLGASYDETNLASTHAKAHWKETHHGPTHFKTDKE